MIVVGVFFCRPDVTFAVHWALKNPLSIYLCFLLLPASISSDSLQHSEDSVITTVLLLLLMMMSPRRDQFLDLSSLFCTHNSLNLSTDTQTCTMPLQTIDNQLYKESLVSQIQPTIHAVDDCVADLKAWVTQNKLQLNDTN